MKNIKLSGEFFYTSDNILLLYLYQKILHILPRKNFRPSLSMWIIDQTLPGAAANDTYIELIKTSGSGTGLAQNSSSPYLLVELGLNPISIISHTDMESSGWTL